MRTSTPARLAALSTAASPPGCPRWSAASFRLDRHARYDGQRPLGRRGHLEVIEVAGREFLAELEVVAAPGGPVTDAPQDRGAVGREVHRFRYDAERPQHRAVLVPHGTGPEREVEHYVRPGAHEIKQARAQCALDLAVHVGWQRHRGDAA